MHWLLKINDINAEYITNITNHDYYGGVLYTFRFPNGYGASVIKHRCTYGGKDDEWELAVLFNNDIVYDTPITNDVLGFLKDEEVDETLTKIRQLPSRIKFERWCDRAYTAEEYETWEKLDDIFLQQAAEDTVVEYCMKHNCCDIVFDLDKISRMYQEKSVTLNHIWEDVVDTYVEERRAANVEK